MAGGYFYALRAHGRLEYEKSIRSQQLESGYFLILYKFNVQMVLVRRNIGEVGRLSRHTRGCFHRGGVVNPSVAHATAPLSGAPGSYHAAVSDYSFTLCLAQSCAVA